MKSTLFLAGLVALTLTACGENKVEQTPVAPAAQANATSAAAPTTSAASPAAEASAATSAAAPAATSAAAAK